MFEGRLIEDEPSYVRIQCDDLEAPIYVDHGVSSAPGATVWAAIRPEKIMHRPRAARRRRQLGRRRWCRTSPTWATCRSTCCGSTRARSCASRSRTSYRHADDRITWDERVYLHWHAGQPGGGDRSDEPSLRCGWRLPSGRALVIGGPVPVAAAVLPDPVRDRAQDQLLEQRRSRCRRTSRCCTGPATRSLQIKLNLGNFAFLVEDDLYWKAYLNSIKVAAISTLLCLLIGYPMAYAIARSTPIAAQHPAAAGHPAVLDVVPAARLCLDRHPEEQRRASTTS